MNLRNNKVVNSAKRRIEAETATGSEPELKRGREVDAGPSSGSYVTGANHYWRECLGMLIEKQWWLAAGTLVERIPELANESYKGVYPIWALCDKMRSTPMSWEARRLGSLLLKSLIEKYNFSYGIETPLHLAAVFVTKVALLERFVRNFEGELDHRNEQGYFPLEVAKQAKNWEAVRILAEAYVKVHNKAKSDSKRD